MTALRKYPGPRDGEKFNDFLKLLVETHLVATHTVTDINTVILRNGVALLMLDPNFDCPPELRSWARVRVRLAKTIYEKT